MKSFEEICETYNRTNEEVESDLYAVLQEIAGKSKASISDHDYKHVLKLCLIHRQCILADLDGSYEVTKEGQRVLQRGWITKDYKALKDKQKKEYLIKYITLAAGVVTAVATLLTAFLAIFK